jgi:hypothetical protein
MASKLAVAALPKKPITIAQRNRLRVRAFRPIAQEIGWLAYEWNRLHEALAELFTDIITKSNANVADIKVAYAIWHSTPNDRTQREMLLAVINDSQWLKEAQPRGFEDVKWILKQLIALSGRRNDAIHAPLLFISDLSANTIEIIPSYFFGNPRATELRDKNLVEEFRWYKDHLARLAAFSENLHYAISFPDFS